MKIFLKVFPKGAVILILTAPFLFSQDLPKLTLKSSFNEISSLTSFARNYDPADSIKGDTTIKSAPKTKKFRMKKSPTVAVLLSAVLPGAGQFYNQSYWKIPIIGGLVGYFAYEYFRNNNLYKDNRDLYAASQTPENPEGDQNFRSLREFYRSQRNDFVWYFLIIYTINMIDAYVDAHLFDFDVRDNKSLKLPNGRPNREYRLKLNFRL